jgi:hypothetical protein
MNEEKQNEEKQNEKKGNDILKWIIVSLAVFLVIIMIFVLGTFVGANRAKFSYKWAENYHKNFSGPRQGFFNDWRRPPIFPDNFIEGHGIFGEIIKINDNGFVIKDRGDIEKVVLIDEKTIIKDRMKNVGKDELKVGVRAVVIGSPDEQGQIQAKLIRVFNEEMTEKMSRKQFSLFKQE